jgi:hypothetical protein
LQAFPLLSVAVPVPLAVPEPMMKVPKNRGMAILSLVGSILVLEVLRPSPDNW